MSDVIIYTDGACSYNPGPGGYGALLLQAGKVRELGGFAESTTNNRMEMQAVLEGFKALKRPCEVKVVSDSKYVIDGITKWVHGWKKRGWKKADKKPVLNKEIWQALVDEEARHTVSYEWVKGHSGHPENDRVDEEACRQRDANR